MRQLHYYPSNASMAPHILLHELGLPFEKCLVDRERNAHKSADYLKLNPNGLIPVLVDGELVLYETAAICLHLVDSQPAAGLAPALGTAERAHFYKWLIWMTNTLQATLIHYFYPHRLVDDGNAAGERQVQAHAQARVGELLDQLEAQLASHGQPWLLGAQYSAVDPYAFMLCRWTRGFEGPAAAPARTRPLLGAYLQRLLARPAVQRVLADEGLQSPWV
ncbi:glutathione S-transferase family protein [Aquabacterium sp.]|uniref:glutathione S-transferase family protein n=1 Tax=Aquabacterium sp. TaxID=1872578 RepID=UPI002BC974FD|nr:glutathione S-transferase family protein [Aquabacterium sp.]HSW03407.1 glutathione S-transferase family protein [Aquabacterium sp.]